MINKSMSLMSFRGIVNSLTIGNNIKEEKVIQFLNEIGEIKNIDALIMLRNELPAAYDIVISLLIGKWINPNQLMVSFIGKRRNCRVALGNSPRTSALRSISVNTKEDIINLIIKCNIEESDTIEQCLDKIKNSSCNDEFFSGVSQNIIYICEGLKKIWSNENKEM